MRLFGHHKSRYSHNVMAIKCNKCGNLIKTSDDHDENCTAKQEALANLAAASSEKFFPDIGLWLIYGLVICAALAGMIIWKMYL